MPIKIGINGYGNLGKGVELAIRQNPDLELAAVLTRRSPSDLKTKTPGVPVLSVQEAGQLIGKVDVMILCGGSATDLPEQGPIFARLFHTVDSFDTHAKIPEYFDALDQAAKESGHISLISVGWDPGLFSLNRLYTEAILPQGKTYTFWGKGVSQGHSDAIRRIAGVKHAIQYTIPVEKAVESIRNGETPALTAREKHIRECYVVVEEGADRTRIEREIREMPNYFADYDTTVHFITEEELKRDHSGMPHGGFVIRNGKTGQGTGQTVEYSLRLGSNPEFTSSVLVAYARAAYRMASHGMAGAKTVFDVPPAFLSPKSGAALRKELL